MHGIIDGFASAKEFIGQSVHAGGLILFSAHYLHISPLEALSY
jgi:hypothetical protein